MVQNNQWKVIGDQLPKKVPLSQPLKAEKEFFIQAATSA